MSRFALVVGFSAAWVGTHAYADPILRIDLTQLAVSYDARANVMIAQAVNVDPLASAGSIERVLSPAGVATFAPPGFVSNDSWSFAMFSTVVVESPELASGIGFLAATDHDGDSFRAELRTTFRFARPGVIEMSAAVRNFQFTNIVDGIFEGSDERGWSMTMGSTSEMAGSVHAEVFGGTTFFSGSFAGRDMHLTGDVVPAPTLPALVAIAGAIVSAQRRRPRRWPCTG